MVNICYDVTIGILSLFLDSGPKSNELINTYRLTRSHMQDVHQDHSDRGNINKKDLLFDVYKKMLRI